MIFWEESKSGFHKKKYSVGKKFKKIAFPLKVNFFAQPGFELLAKNDPHSYFKLVFTVKISPFFHFVTNRDIPPPKSPPLCRPYVKSSTWHHREESKSGFHKKKIFCGKKVKKYSFPPEGQFFCPTRIWTPLRKSCMLHLSIMNFGKKFAVL